MITLEYKHNIESIFNKFKSVLKKYYEIELKYGEWNGSVFDGGLYKEIKTDKMPKDKFEEWLLIKKDYDYIKEIQDRFSYL